MLITRYLFAWNSCSSSPPRLLRTSILILRVLRGTRARDAGSPILTRHDVCSAVVNRDNHSSAHSVVRRISWPAKRSLSTAEQRLLNPARNSSLIGPQRPLGKKDPHKALTCPNGLVSRDQGQPLRWDG